LVAEVVRNQTEVIVASSANDALIVHAATTTIPIVSVGAGDLVRTGLAASLARPGQNVTGMSTPALGGKQLQLLQEAVPALARVAVLYGRRTFDPADSVQREPYEAAGRALGLEIQYVGGDNVDDLEGAFDAAVREQADGILVQSGALTNANETRINELALERRLPSIWALSDGPSRGGLMAYAPNKPDQYRRVASFVDKILRGANPADLPIELPEKFDFVINLQTAQSLGLTIPQSVLGQATEIIR